jgi:Nif-specific regulatory protein
VEKDGCHCTDGCHFFLAEPSEIQAAVSDGACRVIDEVSLLFEISQTLERSLDLDDVMLPVLERMSARFGMKRGAITLQNRRTKRMLNTHFYGIPPELSGKTVIEHSEKHLRYVFESGKPVVVPDVSKEPDYTKILQQYDAMGDHEILSYLCVPIKMGEQVVGSLSMERVASRRKGFDADIRLLLLIASVISRAVELRQMAQERFDSLEEENAKLHEYLSSGFKPDNMVGNSGPMRLVYKHIQQVAPSDATVLLRGESGTGKELAAFAIHAASNRKGKPFIKFNCAALPESIIESELFGHEKGAFTGALAMRKGRFEAANGGTIFLDEIGDISPTSQVKLLRVIQEKTIERVGSHEPIRCDVRVITATSRNLEQMMEEGKFREDLYYRLNVFPIYLPALRHRKSDILLLADHFVEKFNRTSERRIRRISSAAIDMLTAYHWPGNVRELENCIERAILLCDEDAIQAHHLPPTLQMKEPGQSKGHLDVAIEALEREMIVDALKAANGKMAGAARDLGLTERILGLRLRKYGIDPKQFKRVVVPSARGATTDQDQESE